MEYNGKLKAMIHKRGLKHNWLAAQLGVDSAVFTKWITGGRQPTALQRSELARLLGCLEEEIFDKSYY